MDEKFIDSMRALLGDELDAFIDALMLPPIKALRVNTLKVSVEDFAKLCPMPLEKNPFSDDGFIYDGEVFLAGLSPFHHAGLYYIQEPSTFTAIEYLRPYIGKRVLDLCAAPGGKAGFVAALMKNEGFIVANDVEFVRAKVLSQNFERLGITNALVTSNSPAYFENSFPSFFDTVIVDAPCSGEGMLRKTELAHYSWSEKGIGSCFVRQSQILHSAAEALAEGGHLLYCTCTLNTTENEEVIRRFLATHDFEIVPVPEPLKSRVRSGFGIDAARVFPQDGGEGHFSCLLRKLSGEEPDSEPRFISYSTPSKHNLSEYKKAIEDISCIDYGPLFQKDDSLIALTEGLPIAEGMTVLRAGLKLADISQKQFTPAHALAMSLKSTESKKNIDFSFCSSEIRDYLSGNTINIPPAFSGFGTISVNGFCTGLVKGTDDMYKNHYPKGLRMFIK